MHKTPKNHVIPFPVKPASTVSTLVPATHLFFGRFTASERQEVLVRFHENGESIKKLAVAFSVGNSLIEALVRAPRKPMASSRQNDRRERRTA